ncbi:MAG TPA: acetyl-CoA carboxylase, carboxyltransferase subunit beta [Polyangiaceae bacterium]|nr:acetyl-CoA carboxylase, carboxyltransferase subunit beta [Polyangiaceae bacterium]
MPLPEKNRPQTDASAKRSVGKGVFVKCDGCAQLLDSAELARAFGVCPACGRHHRIGPDAWRALILDHGELDPWDESLAPVDPLGFHDGQPYPARVEAARRSTGEPEAVLTGRGAVEGLPVAFGLFVFRFMGGSMNSVVGEKVTRLFERAAAAGLPVVLLQSSGGARMQEGIYSLMQMAKAVAARERLRDAGLPFLSVLLDPTTGGVAASFALLGDVNLAEPGALIGFAGPRVIETTIRQTLPPGFQRAEFLLEHGMVDLIAPRPRMKETLVRLLHHLRRPSG